MFDYVYKWMLNIASYMLMVTVAMQMIPNHHYKKYIRFFTGLLLIVLLSTPLLKIAGMEGEFRNIYKNASYEQEILDIEEKTKYLEEVELPQEEGMKEEGGDVGFENIQIGEVRIGE